jgi:hypothetical protein
VKSVCEMLERGLRMGNGEWGMEDGERGGVYCERKKESGGYFDA